jgi:hypothetical protein
MPMVSVEYEYNLPDSFMADHSFSEGKKRSTTYDGPDKIWLIIDEVTGKETHGPLTAEEKADGRPVPLGSKYHEIDCIENPLFCQLRAPIIDEAEEDHQETVIHPLCNPVEGYPNFTYQTPLLPRNIYDKYNTYIDLATGEPVIPVYDVHHAIFGRDGELPDWDYVRRKRTKLLESCDPKVSEDLPEAVKAPWIEYRQKLRDFPAVMQAAGNLPWVALRMLPQSPDDTKQPLGELPTIY